MNDPAENKARLLAKYLLRRANDAWFPVLLLIVLTTPGCAARLWNEPIGASNPEREYRFINRAPRHNDPKTLVVLAFSGGGLRAAAFSYGVLEKLRQTMVTIDGVEHPLLQEVDVISAVSGGSFTAAYYGLFGDRLFADFDREFLKNRIQQKFYGLMLNPVNLVRISRQDYSLTDLTAQWLDRHLFQSSTFGQMSLGGLPYIIINATDLNNGMTFSFVQEQFDFLCSDVNSYPVANAAIASGAAPGIFSPVPVRNFDSDCKQRHQKWVDEALLDTDHASRNYLVAKGLENYYLPAPIPLVRLADGGVTDNLGVRGSIMSPVLHSGNVGEFHGGGDLIKEVTRVLVIVANAQVHRDYPWSRTGAEPGVVQVLSAAFTSAVSLLNKETVAAAKEDFASWGRIMDAQREPGRPKVDIHFVQLIFADIKDPMDRAYFNAIPPALSLPDADVERIKKLAHQLMEQSGEFNSFVSELQLQ